MGRCFAMASTVFALLASATDLHAQVPRNGPEWGGKDHQPTQAGVQRREDQAAVRAPPDVVRRNQSSIDQIGRQLLHEEAVDPPRYSPGSSPP